MENGNGKDRRNDIGYKIGGVILYALIALLMMVFLNRTYDLAITAQDKASINEKDIAVLKSQTTEVLRRLESIDTKTDVISEKLTEIMRK